MPTAHPMPIPAPGKKVKKKRKKVQVRPTCTNLRTNLRVPAGAQYLPQPPAAALRAASAALVPLARLCFDPLLCLLEQIVANLQHCGYPIIHRAVKDLGWKVAERGESWDFGWSDNNHLLREMSKMFIHPRTLQPVQRVNHLPNNKHLYRKDTLATNMMNLRAEMPDEFRAPTPLLPCGCRGDTALAAALHAPLSPVPAALLPEHIAALDGLTSGAALSCYAQGSRRCRGRCRVTGRRWMPRWRRTAPRWRPRLAQSRSRSRSKSSDGMSEASSQPASRRYTLSNQR